MKVSAHITEGYGENVKILWLNEVILSFYTTNSNLHIKKSEQESAITITHHEDLWQFQETE